MFTQLFLLTVTMLVTRRMRRSEVRETPLTLLEHEGSLIICWSMKRRSKERSKNLFLRIPRLVSSTNR